MADAQTTNGMPQPGDTVAGVKLVKLLHGDSLMQAWRGENPEGAKVGVYVLDPSVSGEAAYGFHAGALKLMKLASKTPVAGVLRIHSVQPDGRAFVADLWTVGNASDLPALKWEMEKRLELLQKICEALQGLHDAGIVHGCLAPPSVLLDDELHPVIADTMLYDPASILGNRARAPYVAPEIEAGKSPSIASDVFAAGQLLHFLLLDRDPPPADPDLSRLEELAAVAPGGLVRILRRAIAAVPGRRYKSVAELMADLARYTESDAVGLAHPEVREANPKGVFTPGQRANAAANAESKRGQARPEASAPATARKPAIARPTAPKPTAKREPQPTWTRNVALASALVLGLSLLLGYTTGSLTILWRILSALGVAGMTLAIPLPTKVVRMTVAGVGFLIGMLVNLGGQATLAGASNLLQSHDPNTVVAAMRALRSGGATKFSNAIVQGGDLSGINLDNTDCDWVDFSSANLTDASFVHATLIAATLKDANIQGANFTEANMTMVADLELARCDERTKLPAGWKCEEGHPKR